MIVFGHNNFRMRSYTHEQVGLPESYNAYTIEVRQRYGHIFWIPLFPIGQIWGLRKHADGQLYEMPASVKEHVRQNVKVPGVSIWAFSGLLLVGLIGVIAMISNMVQQAHMNSVMKELHAAEYKNSMSIIADPKQGDTYNFLDKNSYESKKFIVSTIAPDKLEMEQDSYKDVPEEESRIWIKRADLKSYMSEDEDRDFRGMAIPGIKDGKYVLENVERGVYEEKPPETERSGDGAKEAKDK
jgi:hypothetical protein